MSEGINGVRVTLQPKICNLRHLNALCVMRSYVIIYNYYDKMRDDIDIHYINYNNSP